MAYTYCGKCDRGLDEPTPSQVLYDDYECPCCGYSNSCPKSVNELILELIERIETLEARSEVG